MAPWPLAFSDAFAAQVRDLLDARPVVLVAGPVGSGRARLAAVVTHAPEGPLWWRHLARPGEQDIPFFVVSTIFQDVEVGASEEPAAVATRVRAWLQARHLDTVTLILLNAELCDRPSIEVLSRLATGGALRIVATVSLEARDAIRPLAVAAEEVRLDPLDRATVEQLLQVRFGCRPDPAVVDVLLERSNGAYGVLQDICDASAVAGDIVVVETTLVLGPGGPWPYRAGEAPGEVVDLLDLTALIGAVDLGEARDATSPDRVDEVIAHGAVRLQDGSLVFVSTPESMLRAQSIDHVRRADLFERYAHRFPISVSQPVVAIRCADWWRATGRELPPDLAARAAREANRLGRYRRAMVYTDPANNSAHALVAPIERVFALVELGQVAELESMFSAIDPTTLTEDELLPYLRWVHRSHTGRQREQLVDRAVSDPADPEATRRRTAVWTLTTFVDRVYSEASDELIQSLRALVFSHLLSPVNLAVAYGMISTVERHAGRADQAVASAAFGLEILRSEGEDVSAFHLDTVRESHIIGLITAVDLDAAETSIAFYTGGTSRRVSGRFDTALLGLIDLFRGDLDRALMHTRLCIARLQRYDPHQMRGWVEAMLAQILVQVGRSDEARYYLELSTQHGADRVHHDFERRITQACAYDVMARPEEALRLLATVIEDARPRGIRLAQIDAAVLAVQIGGLPHLDDLLEAVDGLVDPSGTPAVWQAFAWALRDRDLQSLVRQAEHLHSIGAALFAAEVAQCILDVWRRAPDLDEATRQWLRSLADPMTHRKAARA